MDNITILEQLQGKIKKRKYVVIAAILYSVCIATIIILASLNIITFPVFPDGPIYTIGVLFIVAVPIFVCVEIAYKYEKCRQQYMIEYNKMFYLKAFTDIEGIDVIDIYDYGIDANNYENYDRNYSYFTGDRTRIDYFRQSLMSISAKINDMEMKLDNYIMWTLDRADYLFSRKNGIKRAKYCARDGEIIGEITNSTKLVYKYSISHKFYNDQVSHKEMSNYPEVAFGIKELDKNYTIKTMDDTKTKKLITDKVTDLMEKINNFNMPMYIYMEGNKIEFRIKFNDFKQYPSVSSKIDYNQEMTRVVFRVNALYDLFCELSKHN